MVLAAEKPVTLAMLTHDSASLQLALDQAGVPREGRSVSFQVAVPQTAPAPSASHTDLAAGAPPMPHASTDPNANQHQHDPHGTPRRPRAPVPVTGPHAADAADFAGNIDITA